MISARPVNEEEIMIASCVFLGKKDIFLTYFYKRHMMMLLSASDLAMKIMPALQF